LRLPIPYKQFNQLIEQETFEPVLTWGLRMAIAATVPLLWGLFTGNITDATWVSLVAELICWVELKGSFGQRLRVLAGGAVLSLFFTFVGSVTGNIWLSIVFMLAVAFLSGLFKNLGDRGSGLATSVYVLFIITNAYPTDTLADLQHRMQLISIGGAWTILVGIAISAFMPARQPYRRMVGLIWRSIAGLIDTVAKGWDGNATRSSIRDIYLKEKEVRTAIDTSFHFYETMAHQVSKKDGKEYQLAQVRKATALTATHIIAISEELETINIKEIDNTLSLKLYAVLKALQQTVERMAVYVVTLKPEDELLLSSRISRFNKLLQLVKDYSAENDSNKEPVKRIIHLLERSRRLIENCITRLEEMGEDLPVFRSYSLIKTIFILHPKHWLRNLRLLFNLNTFTARYALRIAVASAIAIFIDKWFNINHGYWIPFTVILVSQPYFGATLKKAFERVIGTVTGGVAGGLLLRAHTGTGMEVFLLFLCFIFMVYYLRKNYAVAAGFITFSLVLLFNIEKPIDATLIVVRELSTVGGAALAIIAGFALLPHWDKKWLPRHLADAIESNYKYFIATFFSEKQLTAWTRLKRDAESKNSNAFDSFNRYMQEPAFTKKSYSSYYHLITHNVRLTRELNNIHLEREINTDTQNPSLTDQQQRINMSLYWFRKNMELIPELDHAKKLPDAEPPSNHYLHKLSLQQVLYLDRLIIELKAMYSDLENLQTEQAT
jgi:uncharacterized membrane protein YccC